MSLVTRICMFALAAVAAAGVVVMALERTERDWPISPAWPYEDGYHYHWFYRTLTALDAPGSRMAIWGWAAQAWVYSRTVPATRESSTEFAWRNWGHDGYYRKRFMGSLLAQPPELFMVAVGPSHFMFNDRKQYGTQTMPGLDRYLADRFVAVLDDGDVGLLLRQDVYDRCCRVQLTSTELETEGWLRAGADTPLVAWHASSSSPARAIVIPFRMDPGADVGQIKVGLNGEEGVSGCDVANAAPGIINMCVITEPQGTSWQMAAQTGSSDHGVEIGRPLVILDRRSVP